jgi:hypothetical protein
MRVYRHTNPRTKTRMARRSQNVWEIASVLEANWEQKRSKLTKFRDDSRKIQSEGARPGYLISTTCVKRKMPPDCSGGILNLG